MNNRGDFWMKKRIWLTIMTLLPQLTMLGSLLLMNDNNPASRRGALSVVMFYAANAFLLIFAFFIGFLPKTNQTALRLGCVYFFLYAILYLLRMSERLSSWTSGQLQDQNAVQLIIYSMIGFGVALIFFLAGYLIPHRMRRKAWENVL